MHIKTRKTRKLSQNLIQHLAIILALTAITACNRLSVQHQVTLDITGGAIALTSSIGGGYLIAVAPSVVVKLNDKGDVLWRFSEKAEKAENQILPELKMVSPLADGGAIICGERNNYRAPQVARIPGFVIRIDGNGKEVSRLDPTRTDYGGQTFGRVLTCAPWGSGFAISALTEKGPAVFRLNSQLSVLWSMPLAVGGIDFPTVMEPRELSDGNLIFPGDEDIFIIDQNGNIKRHSKTQSCNWLRTAIFNNRLRFVCHQGDVASSPVNIVEYDESLNIVKTFELKGGTAGFPIVSEFAEGKYISLLYASNSSGPLATLFDANGSELKTFTLPDGALVDGVAESNGNGVIVLVTASVDNPKIYWLSRH